ncbi:hypothetical protein [Archaeoglobus fulgidus]|uniref:Restriction endonuclease type IV Mrr domain-containing protein n=1 Tax=Archaeoglobus fulgidus DSM 8774 TaxID=1344584 RepID=A0A075WG30_ARCFL|nr:hypothetical protein [Archaeoglobus fulgidus]AIG99340.1 hypothetical protein AFULGI_00026300 [Archaeoglobus fulgidus DSM 8774]
MRWQEFEGEVRRICEAHDFSTKFRFVFKDEEGRAEIDVVAERYGIVLCFDAKLYSASRYRASQLRREAEKHRRRCERFSALIGKRAIPVVVSFIDDSLRYHSGCIIVPYHSLNEFLTNLHFYLAEFGFL